MNQPIRVLVVDDDLISRQTTTQQLTLAGYVAQSADSAIAALALVDRHPFDFVLTDIRMPKMDGVTFLRELKRRFPEIDVVLMTAFGTVESAVAAMQDGAADYLTKPFRFQELDLRLRRIGAARATRDRLSRLSDLLDAGAVDGLVGSSVPMQRVRERIHLFATHSAPVLVTGDTGTGKELVARAIHDASPRSRGRFVAVACGAVPKDLAESFFLGHERGAFTGATQRRKGCFEQGDGGTVLLDDVDDLPVELQVKLLRVLQEGVVTRVGGEEEVPIDVRVVATTKVDLAKALESGKFRTDLYYRLRGLEIALPPLRERGDDVVLLATHFLRVIASSSGRSSAVLSGGAVAALRRGRWPGNARELRRAMEAADALARGGVIEPEHLPSVEAAGAQGLFTLRLESGVKVRLGELVRQFEDEVIAWALREANGQQTGAAELLGVPRTTLQSKLVRPDQGR